MLKFVIGQLRLVLSGQQDFKACDWPLRLVSGGQSQTFQIHRTKLDHLRLLQRSCKGTQTLQLDGLDT